MQIPEHHLLEAFLALAETLHFGRAARSLNLTQSTVSHRIRRLEEIIGTPLFDRTRRAVTMTPAGRAFLPRARSAVTEVGRGILEARRVGEGAAGRLVLAYSGAASVSGLLATLDQHAREAPGIVFEVRQASVAQQVEGVVRGEIDFGCTFLELPYPPASLELGVLPGRPLHALVGARHSLAQRDDVTLDVLRRERWIVLSRAAEETFEDYLEQFRVASVDDPASIEVDGLDACLELVRLGVGVSVLPQLPFDVAGISSIPIVPTTARSMSVFWASQSDNPVLPRFVELIRSEP